MTNRDRTFIIICVIFSITNLALSTYLISRSFKSQKQRDTIQQVVENQQKAGKAFECILLTQPQDRTPATIEACKAP